MEGEVKTQEGKQWAGLKVTEKQKSLVKSW